MTEEEQRRFYAEHRHRKALKEYREGMDEDQFPMGTMILILLATVAIAVIAYIW